MTDVLILVNDWAFCDRTTYLAEGVETALSIRDAVNHERVITVLGKENFRSIDPALTTRNIVLCLDNDGESTKDDKLIRESVAHLEKAGKNVILARPEHKGDFNGVAIKLGVEGVSKALNNNFAIRNDNEVSLTKQAMTSYTKLFEVNMDAPNQDQKTNATFLDKSLGQIERDI